MHILGAKVQNFSGGGPRTPRSLAGFACFYAGWQKFLRRTLYPSWPSLSFSPLPSRIDLYLFNTHTGAWHTRTPTHPHTYPPPHTHTPRSVTFLMKPIGETSNIFLYWHTTNTLFHSKHSQHHSCFPSPISQVQRLPWQRGKPHSYLLAPGGPACSVCHCFWGKPSVMYAHDTVSLVCVAMDKMQQVVSGLVDLQHDSLDWL